MMAVEVSEAAAARLAIYAKNVILLPGAMVQCCCETSKGKFVLAWGTNKSTDMLVFEEHFLEWWRRHKVKVNETHGTKVREKSEECEKLTQQMTNTCPRWEARLEVLKTLRVGVFCSSIQQTFASWIQKRAGDQRFQLEAKQAAAISRQRRYRNWNVIRK